ncbi:pilus assembly protein TadG-related protein [Rathayibacter sp. YIM 133350]|uniref:pilus assembly protein TadG-related protein n=1 Tax=Rathayibacter sp. YIM 133350 TaxID=3131992 RepID=UPI00307D4710
MNRLRALRDDERGSTLPLVIFFMVLALLVIIAVAGATSLYIERKRLLTLADGAALAGAEAFDLSQVSAADGELRIRLEGDRVRAAAEEYLDAAPHEQLRDLALSDAGTPDGHSAAVSLTASWRPPVLSLFLPEGITLRVDSTARSVFR